MLETFIKETKEKIAKFIDCDKVVIKVNGPVFEVHSCGFPLFSFNYKEARVIQGQGHKVGLHPLRLHDLCTTLRSYT